MKSPLRTFRARLTLWHLVVMGTILLASGVLLYVGMARGLLSNIDSSLWAIAETEAASLVNPSAGYIPPTPDAGAGDMTQGRVSRFVQLVGAGGDLVSPPPNLSADPLPINPSGLKAARQGRVLIETATMRTGRVRILYLPIEGSAGVSQILMVGLSLHTVETSLAELFRLIATIVASALLLMGVGGFVLTKKALRPVDAIARAAQEISERNLSQRLPEEAGADELAQLVRMLNRMLGRLEQAFKVQMRFTSDASHELRTPLAIMKGSLQVALKKERTGKEYRDVLTSAQEEVDRLSRLVSGLLTLARADAQVGAERRPVKLQPLLGDIVDQMRLTAAARGVTLDFEAAGDLIVMASEDAMKQLFLNLVDNAVRYTPSGGRAWVRAGADDREVTVEVGDTGIGIEEEERARIFDRFYRGARARGSDQTGSGLGLAICAQIVKECGGRIEVESSVKAPSGTSTRIVLPRGGMEAPGEEDGGAPGGGRIGL
ncbi:MAG: sensor histidine kinase [Myxococcota bacterium]